MAKVKNPLLSLSTHGSLKSLTFRRKTGGVVAEKKPELPYFMTLPTRYQRWLYQDYAYLWTQQSAATKRLYDIAGAKLHLTGFQYWMKDMLTRMPDIAAWYRIDSPDITILHDSSRNANTGTIIGASPTAGIIEDSLYFDGINDYCPVPDSPSFHFTQGLTIALWVYVNAWVSYKKVVCKLATGFINGFSFEIRADKRFRFFAHGPTIPASLTSATSLQPETWYPVVCTFKPNERKIYVNGALDGQIATPPAIGYNTLPLNLGRRNDTETDYFNGRIDNCIIYNRTWDAAEALRHSTRRYPAK
ncbi:MAG: LamG domain-containing protein [Desulfobulbaceae bacterium]|nr:LamG domain-containing protein [Desulfobulbaceae bacterium]